MIGDLSMFSTGEIVVLHSLKGRTDLNGAVATLTEWMEDKGRWAGLVVSHCASLDNKISHLTGILPLPVGYCAPDKQGNGELVLVRPENLVPFGEPSKERVAAVRSAIKAADEDAVLSRFVEGVFWPPPVAIKLMAEAWAVDERRGKVGWGMDYGGVVSALYLGMKECQAMLGIKKREGLPEDAGVDNVSMALFSFAIDTDNVTALALVYEWCPDFTIFRDPSVETAVGPSPEAVAALSLGDDDDPLRIDYAYELAESRGAKACFEFLRKRNATAKMVHQARRTARREAGVKPSRLVSCALCGQEADKSQVKRCQRCRAECYCSPECQRAAWPTHKATCMRTECPRGMGYILTPTVNGKARMSTVFRYKNVRDDDNKCGRPKSNNCDPTHKCFLLQLRVRAPGGGDWLSAPRNLDDHKYATQVRGTVSSAMQDRGYRLLEGCLLNAAFFDDGSGESRFVRVATECATAEGAEVKLAALRVDPGIGLYIYGDEYDDSAWELLQPEKPAEFMKNLRRNHVAGVASMSGEKSKPKPKGKNKGKNKERNRGKA